MVLPRWRAKLPPSYSDEFIDGFIRRNRAALETLVERAMSIRRAKRDRSPASRAGRGDRDQLAGATGLVAPERPDRVHHPARVAVG
jgi:hypothetical protein